MLDTNITPELLEEGFVRELISKVQTMRKEADYEVMDKIFIYSDKNDKIKEILSNNKDKIMSEVLAIDIVFGSMDGIDGIYSKEWNINGEDVLLGVRKEK